MTAHPQSEPLRDEPVVEAAAAFGNRLGRPGSPDAGGDTVAREVEEDPQFSNRGRPAYATYSPPAGKVLLVPPDLASSAEISSRDREPYSPESPPGHSAPQQRSVVEPARWDMAQYTTSLTSSHPLSPVPTLLRVIYPLDPHPCVRWIRSWDLWTHTSRPGLVWMLGWELGVLVWAVLACASAYAQGPPSGQVWLLFAALVAAAGCHIVVTRAHEERRRVARLSTEHIDHVGVWSVAAAVALPAHLMVGLVLAVRLQRFSLAHKPPVRLVFGSTAILGSCLAANAITGPLREQSTAIMGGDGAQLAIAALYLAAAAAYFVVETVIVGVARGLRLTWSWHTTIGSGKDNADLGALICLGLIAAMLLTALHVTWVIPVAILAVLWTRNARDRDVAVHDAITDPLTNLLNRRGFDPRARHLLTEHKLCGILAFDLDHFKRVNDQYGHPNGDKVLQAFAEVLRTNAREGDLVCRRGGEEMTILLPGATPHEVRDVAQRMLEAVEKIRVPATTKVGGKYIVIEGLSVSIGVAFHPTHGTTIEELEPAADAALYQAKKNRNCIREASDPPPRRPISPSHASDP